MRRLVLAVAIIAAVIGFRHFRTSPSAPPEMTEGEIVRHEAEVRQELADRADLYEDAMLRGDPAALMSMYTSDARALWPGMDLALKEAQDFVAEMFHTVTFIAYDLKAVDLFVHEDAAYGIYEESETFQMEGHEPETEVFNCFFRWEQEDGVWKIDRTLCGPRDAPPQG